MTYDIVVVGEVAIDELRDTGESRVGGAAYAAVAAAICGPSVLLAGDVGEDIASQELRRMQRYGVEFAVAPGTAAPRWVMARTGPATRRQTQRVEGTAIPRIPEASAAWFLALASRGLDLAEALAVAHRVGARFALDGHDDELLQDRWRPLLKEVDLLLINWETVHLLTAARSVEEGARGLGREDRPTIVKHGRGGATLIDGRRLEIPSTLSSVQVKVGAGDTMAGTVVASLVRGYNLRAAVGLGARAAALFIERGVPAELGELDVQDRPQQYVSPERLAAELYLAAPFFTYADRTALGRVKDALEAAQVRYFSPLDRVGLLTSISTPEERKRTYQEDIAALERAPAVVAILDGDDPGTAWEVGYAVARGKPVVGLRTDSRIGPDNMLANSVVMVDNLSALLDELFRQLARL